MGGQPRISRLAGAIAVPALLLTGTASGASISVPATPFLTEEAPLRPLAGAFGFRISGSLRTGRVRISSRKHEIVIAPGIARTLVDGRGVPLLTAPRFVGGQLVVPAELADMIRRMGGAKPSGVAPSSRRPTRGKKPKTAFLPATTDHTALLLAGGGSGREQRGSGGTVRHSRAPRKRMKPEESTRVRRAGTCGQRAAGRSAFGAQAGRGPDRAPEKVKGVVLIDPGHGGKDEGARGPKGTKEKDVVLRIAKLLARELGRRHVRTELTRADDTFVSLSGRAASANRLKPDVFISIHVNSYPQAYVTGIETWVAAKRPARSKDVARKSLVLAKSVQAALVEDLWGVAGERDRGVRAGNLMVLRRSKVPSVLVETGFISSPKTEKRLNDARYRQKIAKALARGIAESGLLRERDSE